MNFENMHVVAANIPAADWSFEICPVPKVVGRSSGAHVQIKRNGFGISRQHAKFWIDGGYWVEDLGSSFGTFVNRVRLIPQQKTPIVSGDQILLGKMELHIVCQAGFELMQNMEKRTAEDADESVSASSIDELDYNAIPIIPLQPEVLSRLTKSEHEIVIWLMRGIVSEEEIAKRTFRSPNTIRTHMNNIHRKLDVHARHELMALLLRNAAVDSESQ